MGAEGRHTRCNIVHLLLQAYDQHLNMILGEVEETITSVEIDDETYEEIIKVSLPVRLELLLPRMLHCCAA